MHRKTPHMNQVAGTLRRRYLVALSIIGAILIMSQVIIQIAVLSQSGDSRVVNLAGRQRMLSQRITKCALEICESTTLEGRKSMTSELDLSIALWEKSHKGLQEGNQELGLPPLKSEKARYMFAEIEGNFRSILESAKELSRLSKDGKLNAAEAQIHLGRIIENEGVFLKGMDQIVFQLDLEAGQRVTFIKIVEIGLFVLAIITLALEALFIFRPAENEIKKTMNILSVNEDNIRKLFDIAPTPMLLVSTTDLGIIRLNQMATETLQLNFDEAVGRKLYDFMSSEYTRALDVIEEEQYYGQTRKMEVILRDSQGNSYFMLMSVARISYYEDMIFLIGFSDYTDIKKKEQKLELLATVDEMTGLTNRRTGLAILEKTMELCKRERIRFSVCFIDLDGLKSVNDIFGHQEGDWFIKSAASVLMRNARAEDTVFRYGGDEIVMILSNCDEECGRNIMKRVIQEIAELNLKSGKPFKVDLSYGIEGCSAETDNTVAELIEAADEKMYKQKDGKKLNKKYPKKD